MKKLKLASITLAVLAALATFVYSGTLTKGLIGKQDLYLWYTVSSESTFQRDASTGHALTLNVVDWPGIDCLQIYGGGVRMTDVTLSAAITALTSGNNITLWLAPGTWTVNDDIAFPSNVRLAFPAGAVFSIGTGYTVTIPSPDNIIASSGQQIFSGAGRVSFSAVGGSIMSVKWWGAKGDATTDDTTAIQAAVTAQNTTAMQYYVYSYHYAVPELYFPAGHYVVSAKITCGSLIRIKGEKSIIRSTNAAAAILDIPTAYDWSVKGITFVGGTSQISFSKTAHGGGAFDISDCEFTYNNADFAIKAYLTSPMTYFDYQGEISRCKFYYCYRLIQNELSNVVHLKDCSHIGYYPTMPAVAQIVNTGRMYMDGFDGSPQQPVALSRWIDNHGDIFITNSRFGGEYGGMPIVYHYEAYKASNNGGGAIVIENCGLCCGAIGVENTIIRLMTGIPGLISIKNNNWIFKDSTDFIKVDGAFDIVTYIGAMGALERCFIDIGNNQSTNVSLEYIGLPDLLVNTNRSKVQVGTSFRPFVGGTRSQGLIHFDGASDSTVFVDEYGGHGIWTQLGDGQLSTAVSRFGRSSLSAGSTGYANNGIQSSSITSVGTAFTFEGWWYTTASNVEQGFINFYNAGGYGVAVSWNNLGSDKFKLYVSSDGTTWDVANGVAGTATMSDNTWYKVAAEFTGSTYTFWIGTPGSIMVPDIVVSSSSVPCAVTSCQIAGSTLGYFDEFRYLIGDYRYGSPWFPEAEPFHVY